MPDRNFISRVALQNFKSIRHCDVRLGQITFLVGLNGAGKSNFVGALRFLSNALSTSLEAALLEGDGFGNIRRRGSLPPAIGFEIGFQLGLGSSGEYKLEIHASSDGLSLLEECRVSVHGERHWYKLDGEKVESSEGVVPAASGGRLYLVNASGLAAFEPVHRLLSNMEIYNPIPNEFRDLGPQSGIRNLDRNGRALAEILRRTRQLGSDRFYRIIEYLQRVNPAVESVDVAIAGSRYVLLFVLKSLLQKPGIEFTSLNMSDGTLRALAVLVALFQDNPHHPLSLIGLEEPEAGLHPAAASVLFDALMEGGQFRQVIVTTHSADLLDRDDIPDDALKAVVMEDGQTYIGDVDSFGKKAIKEHLYTAGELLRMDQLRPEKVPELSNIG